MKHPFKTWKLLPQRRILLFNLVFASLIANFSSAAETGQLTGTFFTFSGLKGIALQGTFLAQPVPDRGLWLGPRMGLQWGREEKTDRLDLHAGVEGVVWLLNAFGLGLGADFFTPSLFQSSLQNAGTAKDSPHYRLEPFLAIRLLHFKNEGAWALRVSAPYDTLFKWGIHAGVSLQFDGARPGAQSTEHR